MFTPLNELKTHPFAVLAFHSHCRHVLPAKEMDHLDNRLRLKIVRRYHSTEILEPTFVRELGASGRVAHLRYLQSEKDIVVRQGR